MASPLNVISMKAAVTMENMSWAGRVAHLVNPLPLSVSSIRVPVCVPTAQERS